MNIKKLHPHLLKSALWREFALSRRLGWLYIARGRKWTLALTIFLMAVAFVNLVFVSSLLGGINQKIESQVKDLMVGDIYVSPSEYGDVIGDAQSATRQVASIDGVTGVSQSLMVYAELTDGKNSVQAPLRIVDPKEHNKTFDTEKFITKGDFLAKDDEIVVGRQLIASGDDKQLTRTLETTKVGDTITLKINGREFPVKVGGELTTKFVNADSEAFISRSMWEKISNDIDKEYRELEQKLTRESQLPAGMMSVLPPQIARAINENADKQSDEILRQQQKVIDLFPAKDAVSMISVRTESGKEQRVEQAIHDKRISGVDVHSWQDAAGYMKSISGSFVAIDAIMLVVGIFIAAVTIFIVIYVDIINKRRQIGIQRAIGVKPRVVVFSYVLLSLFYAFCGIALGLVLFYGVLVPYYLVHPLSLPIADVNLYISPEQLILRIHIVLVVALVSGIIPAIMASRMKMLEAILGRG